MNNLLLYHDYYDHSNNFHEYHNFIVLIFHIDLEILVLNLFFWDF